MAAAAMATLATVEAATITPLSYPDVCEGKPRSAASCVTPSAGLALPAALRRVVV
jgi:hypothetical protein